MPEITKSLTTSPASGVRWAEGIGAVALATAVLLVPLLYNRNTPYALDIKRPISGTCALLAGLALLARWAAGGRIPDTLRGVVRAGGMFVAALAVSLVFAPHTQAGLRGTWLIGSHVIIFVAAAIVFRRRAWAEAFVIVLLITACIVAAYGCLQAAGSDIAPLSWSKGDHTFKLGPGQRVLGTIGLETALGGYMAASAILALGAMLHFKNVFVRAALAIGACVIIRCMFFSGTRLACVAFAVGLAVGIAMAIRSGRWTLRSVVLAAILIGALGASSLLLPGVRRGALRTAYYLPVVGERMRRLPEDASVHTTIWKSAWAMFEARPAVGVGPGAFAINFPEFRPADYAGHRVSAVTLHAHNEYLQILAEAGMLGAVPFAVIIGLVVLGSGRVLTGPGGKDRMLLNAALAATVTMLVHASASVDVRYPTCQLILWVLLGLTAARWQDAPADNEGVAPPAAMAWRRAVVFAGVIAALVIWNTHVYGPHQARVWLNRAETRQQEGQWAGSVEAASRAIRSDPASVPSYHVLANSLFYAGEYEAALAAFDKLQTHSPGYADSHARIGVVNVLLGRMDAARAALRLARSYNAVTGKLARADELADDELREQALAFENKERGRPHRTTPPARSLPSAPACGSRDTSPPAK